ncbi:MAG: glycoside hydrolase TIM-barrel-like domain-containing protein [Xanthobacteraceae bacterium]|nr:glycoside hydrolase TIM-barrel-like domain-containing protein [Xanthobacteraceae bacterium]MBX3550182.1 glycoside hydrolase TIM-barrel-like domain-containing protein [Xanthobacteraceae bacterium]
MAALLLSFAGMSAGSALFGAGGAVAGRLVGAVAGSVIDRALFGDNTRKYREGPRLASLDVMGSSEGAAIPRVYGRARMSGQVIWATKLEEVISTRSESAGGGKGGGPRVTTTTYSYFANFAIGLCEGPIAGIGRMWVDGKQLDLSQYSYRVYRGDGEQLPDPLIEAKEALGEAPAYRGLAYIVFERLPLENFGNRIPQVSVEVIRPVGRLENMIRAVTVIPGATEFGYDPLTVTRTAGYGVYAPENRHTASAESDWTASLDELQAICPNLQRVALVVAWFGSDLRAGECEVRPKVDRNDKQTHGAEWSVAGLSRGSAEAVSLHEDRPAFGGTPSDASVLRAIEDLHARGLEVTLYPFVMMDIPADNALENPNSGESGQPVYPWRGQITCDPAPGREGSPDGTEAAATQIASLFGAAQASDFSATGTNIVYSGPAEWSLRRMVLHYAKLCALAGGVESFLIGSEYEALTRVRSASGVYPAVDELVSLASEAREILGTDTDEEARRAQTRLPIEDGGFEKPWMFRQKDLWYWWSEPHVERVGGEEASEPTAWIAQSKPLRLTEAGCPAVDKGANQPNVFPDAKSSSGGYPYFSNRRRDDLIQRRYLEAICAQFDPAFGAGEGDNPASALYDGRMIDAAGIYPWAWDARPYPAFPLASDVWADGANWESGHWLNGRLGAAPLEDMVSAILDDAGVDTFDTSRLRGAADGYVIDRPMSARGAIEPLSSAFTFDAVEENGEIVFRQRGGGAIVTLSGEELVVDGENADCRFVRAQETELPVQIALGFTEVAGDFRRAAVLSRRLAGDSRRESRADLALITSDAAAERAADIWLQDLWAGRERAEFSLPPSCAALSPGDIVDLDYRGRIRRLEILEAVDAGARAIKARSIDPEVFNVAARSPRPATIATPSASGPPEAIALDLPLLHDGSDPVLQHLAVHTAPWPGAMAVWRSANGETYERVALANVPAVIGETLDPLPAGPVARWDHANRFRVRLASGALVSQSDLRVLDGANAAAIRNADGAWEVIQFASAELVETDTYLLSRLLRGQQGSEWAMPPLHETGAVFVLLDDALAPVARGVDLIGRSFRYRVGSATQDVGSPQMTEFEIAVGATALLPWSPVHLAARRTEDGIVLTWIRRTRSGGDGWDTLEVPLGEEREAYRVEILDGEGVVRTLETDAPQALYVNADEAVDFGGPLSSIAFRVSQLSAVAGAGRARNALIPL